MKRFNAVIIIVVVILVIAAIFYFCFIRKKKIKSALFIGDSNTAADYSYADKFQKAHPEIIVRKIAKVGAKTSWMLDQLSEELTRNKYDMIAILGGSNDIYALGEIDSAKNNLSTMYQLAKASGAKVVSVSPPCKDFYIHRTDEKQQLLAGLTNWIQNNSNTDVYLDFNSMTRNKDFFSPADGYLHANSAAHELLTNELIQKVI